MTLYERWDHIHQALTVAAEEIGVPAERISKGDFQAELPIKPPGIVINLEAGDFVFRNDPTPGACTVTVFFITRPATTKPDDVARAISDAIALGWRALRVLRTHVHPLRCPVGGIPPVQLDTVQGDLVAASFAGVSAFDV